MSILSKPSNESTTALVPTSGARGGQAVSSSAPRARLMPPEVGHNQRKRAVRRNLRLLVVLVAVVVVMAVGGAFYLSFAAQTSLLAAQREAAKSQARLAKLGDIKNTEQWITNAEAARRVGGSTDVDWARFFSNLQSHLPNGVSLDAITVESADAIVPVAQSDIPLEKERIATVTFTATSAQLPKIPDWIDGLSSLEGFADATPGSVTFSDSDNAYTAAVVMHLDTDVYSHRYAEEKKK